MSHSHQVPQIPDLNVLWQDTSLQALVELCLSHLADSAETGTKIKSLMGGGGGGGGGGGVRGGSGAKNWLHENGYMKTKWLHEYVLSGLSKEHISYDQLFVT